MDVTLLAAAPSPPPDASSEEALSTFLESFFSKEPLSWTKLLYAALLLVACIVISRIIMSVLARTLTRLGVEKSLHTFLKSTVHILLWFLTVLIVAGYIGIPVSSLIALLGVAGLALSLALQGTLANLAGGIMVLVSKPFKMGDYIEAGGVSGTVADIGLVYTRINTFDNKLIFVPNGEVSKEKIVNYTHQEQRRVDLTFSLAYEAPSEQVKNIMHAAIGRHGKTLFTPEPFVRMTKINDSNVDYTLRVWCATEDYWDVYYDLLEQLWDDFAAAGVDLTYNHLNVHIKGETVQTAKGERGLLYE